MTHQSISILIVDDERAIRDLFRHILLRRGHEVITCGSAEEGLRNTEEREFDVVILDVGLPEMSGLEMAEELHRRNARSQVIVLTGDPPQGKEIASRKLNVFRYLSKPIRAATLVEVVEEAGSLPPSPLADLN